MGDIKIDVDVAKATKRMVDVLASKGIRMSVGGCGCCGSPWIKFEADGEKILPNYEDDAAFNMFPDEGWGQ